jgi:hypothetical protein
MVVRRWSLDGWRIREIPVDDRRPVMEGGLAWPGSRAVDPCAKALQDFLASAFGGTGSATPGVNPI